jgi:hypothetical protein
MRSGVVSRRGIGAGVLVVVSAVVLLLAGRLARSAADDPGEKRLEAPHRAVVKVYGEKLTPADKLSDGENGRPIRIPGEATLIWVDLQPGARFAHETEYVLITPRGTNVAKGQWWPVLNGKAILREDKPTEVRFPMELNETTPGGGVERVR